MWSDVKDVADELGDDVVSALCVWASGDAWVDSSEVEN